MKKRILLSLMSFFAMTSMWASLAEAYQLYLTAGANGKTGANATLTLNLKNQAAIATWSCVVALPEGVTFVEGSEAVVPNRFPEGYNPVITATVNADGTLTLAGSGEEGVAITGTEGAIVTFEVAVASTVEPGDYQVIVKAGATMEGPSGDIHPYAKDNILTWTIEQGEVAAIGDVNGDGEISIADAVAVLNAMAGEDVPGNADVNGDGDVNIADFVQVLNLMAGE